MSATSFRWAKGFRGHRVQPGRRVSRDHKESRGWLGPRGHPASAAGNYLWRMALRAAAHLTVLC